MMVQKLLPLGLAFIMFALGLNLKIGDFTRLLRHPLPVGLGLFVQMVLLPVMAFLLLMLFPMRPEFAVGVMILAACPGGITSNMITHLARGDVALSVTLTAITSLAGMMTIPFITALALDHFMGQTLQRALPVGQMAFKVFVVASLPLIAGMALNHLSARLAGTLRRYVHPASIVIFVMIVIWAFLDQGRVMMENIGEIGPVVIALNVLIMVLGFALAALAGLPHPQRVTISIEGGLQNGALGIFVATALLQNPAMMTPSITYALVMNASAAAFIAWQLYAARARAGLPGQG
jgi:BASS family bile acid:Na+ symporter